MTDSSGTDLPWSELRQQRMSASDVRRYREVAGLKPSDAVRWWERYVFPGEAAAAIAAGLDPAEAGAERRRTRDQSERLNEPRQSSPSMPNAEGNNGGGPSAPDEPDPSAEETTAQFTILRPVQGPVGLNYADADGIGDRLLDHLAELLDQGDGWIVRDDGSLRWHFSRLCADIARVSVPSGDAINVEIPVVTGIREVDKDVLSLLNSLNAHAVGWVFWLDEVDRTIKSTSRYPVVQREWWWSLPLINGVPRQATVAESIADQLAEMCGGIVAVRPHPQRGTRFAVDGWIEGMRLGSREPSASIDLFLTALDLDNLDVAVQMVGDGDQVRVSVPLCAAIVGPNGLGTRRLTRHWHPEWGWGWQFTTVDGVPDETFLSHVGSARSDEGLLRAAAHRNTALAHDSDGDLILGGWVALQELGLVHHCFVVALELEQIIDGAQDTAGFVMGLMLLRLTAPPTSEGLDAKLNRDVTDEHIEAALQNIHLKIGPIGWSYVVDRVHQPIWGTADPGPNDEWLVPKLIPVCNFGIFNPSGPTVNSLEVSFDGRHWTLWHVMRHPFSPAITCLGQVALDSMDDLNEVTASAFAVVGDGPFAHGQDWLDIFSAGIGDAVLAGVLEFAETLATEVDLGAEAAALLANASDPWERLNAGLEASSPEWTPSMWVDAITNRAVVDGHRLFLRSAWEGSTAMVADGFETATSASNRLIFLARNRALGDYWARGEEGPLVAGAE